MALAKTWKDLEHEYPALVGWVTEYDTQFDALMGRMERGRLNLEEAVKNGQEDVAAAIRAKLKDLGQEVRQLDGGARRAGAVRALLYLRAIVGPCRLRLESADSWVDFDVSDPSMR